MKMSAEKKFGILFFIVFLIISLWPLLNNGQVRYWSLIISSIFLVSAFLFPKPLKPLNKVWIKFGETLGRIIAPIVMSLVFFIVLTPIGIILKIFGKDVLRLKSSKKKTYWLHRNKDVGSMKRQF
tara:strand:- start:87 stop:461 length:375 start_codon:yes stop_codon:yes gene_type:complete